MEQKLTGDDLVAIIMGAGILTGIIVIVVVSVINRIRRK